MLLEDTITGGTGGEHGTGREVSQLLAQAGTDGVQPEGLDAWTS